MDLKRNIEIDMLRGIGILAMVAGHVYFGMYFDKFIHAFHMPLFFIISGFLYKKQDQSLYGALKEVGKKAKRLLIPYVFFSIIAIIVWLLLDRPAGKDITKGLVSVIFVNTENFPVSGALWFLTAMFFTYVFVLILDSLKYKWLRYVLLSFMVILGSIWKIIFNFRLPWGIDVALVAIFFFEIGSIIRRRMKLLELRWFVCAMIFVVAAVLSMINRYVNMRTLTYAIIPLSLFNAVALTVTLWNFCKWFKKCENKIVSFIIKELAFIGKYSMVYLCLNQIVIKLLMNIETLFPSNITGNVRLIVVHTLVLVFAMGVLHLLTYVFRDKLSVLVGSQNIKVKS